MMRGAVLAPGFGGGADQPFLVTLEGSLAEQGIVARRTALLGRGRRPSAGYAAEVAALREARDALRADGATAIALVGRSFGGRICAFLATEEPPDALVIVSHPIAPPGRPRPRDVAALESVVCPTLVVQGDRDELGPLAVVERAAGRNLRVDVVVVRGAGHDLGRHEPEAISAVARWLDATLR